MLVSDRVPPAAIARHLSAFTSVMTDRPRAARVALEENHRCKFLVSSGKPVAMTRLRKDPPSQEESSKAEVRRTVRRKWALNSGDRQSVRHLPHYPVNHGVKGDGEFAGEARKNLLRTTRPQKVR
jgi:hypothetical protein